MERFNGKLVRIYEIHGDLAERLCYMRVKRAFTKEDKPDDVVLDGIIVSFELNKNTGRLLVDTKKASTYKSFAEYEELQVISESELAGIAQACFDVALYKASVIS
mgnify:FL=1